MEINNSYDLKKIMIVWSKWKTSTTMLIDSLFKNTLVVNSEFLRIKEDNKEKYFKSAKELLKLYNTIPTWCPFKFLILKDFFNFDYYISEADINNGFNKVSGTSLGTKKIDIGILTNVYEEHIDGELIKNYDDLINVKISMLFNHTHYQTWNNTNLIININDYKIYLSLLNKVKQFNNRKFKLYLLINKNTNLKDKDFEKIKKYINKIMYYDDKTLNWQDITKFKLSFNWTYPHSSSIIWILTYIKEIENVDVELDKITFPRWLWRMDLVNINNKTFLLDHISEINSFKGLIKSAKSIFKDKDIILIFSLKYDALPYKIEKFSEYIKELLDNNIIKKVYLYDSIEVRKKDKIETKKWTYYPFNLITKIKEKINSEKVEIWKKRDKELEKLLNSKESDNNLYIISINSIESDWFKKNFKMF